MRASHLRNCEWRITKPTEKVRNRELVDLELQLLELELQPPHYLVRQMLISLLLDKLQHLDKELHLVSFVCICSIVVYIPILDSELLILILGLGQQSTGFGSTAFGAGATTTPSLFGATDANKQSAFGQSTFGQTSTFGQPATGGFGMGAQQNTTSSPFGKPAFGATTSTTGFGFGSTAPQNANPFGASTANKPFGTGLQTQTQPVLFGGNTSQPSTGFGTGLFSNTQVSCCFDLFYQLVS